MSVADSSISTDIFERRHRRIEDTLLNLDVLMIYKCQLTVVDQRCFLRVGIWREKSSSIDALETIRRQIDRVRAFMPMSL